jgi:hypothetical protein
MHSSLILFSAGKKINDPWAIHEFKEFTSEMQLWETIEQMMAKPILKVKIK